MYFWKNDRTPEELRRQLRAGHANLTTRDVDVLAWAVFYWGDSAGRIGDAGPLLPYATVLARLDAAPAGGPSIGKKRVGVTRLPTSLATRPSLLPHNAVVPWDLLTQRRVEDLACSALARDFTVGVTESMDSFLVLIALENGEKNS